METAEVLTADSKVHDLNDFIGLLENKIPAMAFKLARQGNRDEAKRQGGQERQEPAVRDSPPQKSPRTKPLDKDPGRTKFTASGSLVYISPFNFFSSSTSALDRDDGGAGVGATVSLEIALASIQSIFFQGSISTGSQEASSLDSWARYSLNGGHQTRLNILFFGAYLGLIQYTFNDPTGTIKETGLGFGMFGGLQLTRSWFVQAGYSLDLVGDSTGEIEDNVMLLYLNVGSRF